MLESPKSLFPKEAEVATRPKKFRTSRNRRWVMVNRELVEIHLDDSGDWVDGSSNHYQMIETGKFVQYDPREAQKAARVPRDVEPKLGEGYTENGTTYQFQPKGPGGKLIAVAVGKVVEPVSLGLADGTRSHVPASPVRTK
jgi:hypothetical protein